MTSKERVQACIDRRPTDAVPLGFYLVDHDIVAKVIGRYESFIPMLEEFERLRYRFAG